MNTKFPRPCDDIKWGRTELWDVFEAAHLVVDIEPSTDADPYFEPEADAVYKQLLMSVALGYPKIVRQIGNRHLFLPLQIVDWATKKGYPMSEVLIAEVTNTARQHLERVSTENAARNKIYDTAPSQVGPAMEIPQATQGDMAPSNEESWQAAAIRLADEIHRSDAKQGAHDSLKSIAERVATKLLEEKKKGPRGPVSGGTVLREALTKLKWTRPK